MRLGKQLVVCVVILSIAAAFGANAARALSTDELLDERKADAEALRAKYPGVAESINWAQALTSLDCVALEPEDVNSTLGTLLKYQDDIARIQGTEATRILEQVKSRARQTASDVQGNL